MKNSKLTEQQQAEYAVIGGRFPIDEYVMLVDALDGYKRIIQETELYKVS